MIFHQRGDISQYTWGNSRRRILALFEVINGNAPRSVSLSIKLFCHLFLNRVIRNRCRWLIFQSEAQWILNTTLILKKKTRMLTLENGAR